jgi:Fe-S cluster assembly protein SufD
MQRPTLEFYQDLMVVNSDHLALSLQAFEKFKAQGFPTRKMENWKYTSINKLQKEQFNFDEKLTAISHDLYKPIVREQVLTGDLIKKISHHPFALLNLATSNNIGMIEVKKGQSPSEAITLNFSLANNQLLQQCLVVKVSENESLTLHVNYENSDDSACFANVFIKVELAKNAQCTIYKNQQLNKQTYLIDNVHVEQKANSYFYNFDLACGATMARSDVDVNLLGSGADVSLNGFYQAKGNQHIDQHSHIQHHVENCTSSEHFRGTIDDKARAVFNGKIIIDKDAQKSQTQQINKNLLLSSQAEVDTKPELEIYANDVKAAHGATVGQLDESALFYLQARGITRADAMQLLMQGFAYAVFDTIKDDKVQKHYKQQLTVGEFE